MEVLFSKTILTFIFLSAVRCEERLQEFPQYDGGACLEAPNCDKEAFYRTYDGSCSSSGNSGWGMAGRPYLRSQAPVYHDGKSAPRLALDGSALPNARQLSAALFQEPSVPDECNTHAVMSWGQLVAHDITQKRLKYGSVTKPCCTDDYQTLPPAELPEECLPVDVSRDDEFYGKFGVSCLSFYRATPLQVEGCDGPREQVNNVTHVIDGSVIYGSDEKVAGKMRTFAGGKLKAEVSKGRAFLTNDTEPAIRCQNPRTEHKCYFAGDERVNQNPGMVVLTTALLRLHNLLCDRMVAVNPHWDDEKMYQEVRRIVWAFLQHVTFEHYLPTLVGRDFAVRKGLSAPCECVNLHDPTVNPAVFHEFSGAAMRSFHSLVAQRFALADDDHSDTFVKTDDYIFRPSLVELDRTFDELMRGLASQPCGKMDQRISPSLTSYFFKLNRTYGGDLEIFDVQCGRDMGLPPYVKLRSYCGLSEAKEFEDLTDVMSADAVGKLRNHYRSAGDIDPFVGGMMETVGKGTLTGPTFQCVIGEQFYHLMRGDRFYYGNCGLPWSFTEEQIKAIRSTSLAWMFCHTGDELVRIQSDVFRLPSLENPVRLCKDIPDLDLTPWKQLT